MYTALISRASSMLLATCGFGPPVQVQRMSRLSRIRVCKDLHSQVDNVALFISDYVWDSLCYLQSFFGRAQRNAVNDVWVDEAFNWANFVRILELSICIVLIKCMTSTSVSVVREMTDMYIYKIWYWANQSTIHWSMMCPNYRPERGADFESGNCWVLFASAQ